MKKESLILKKYTYNINNININNINNIKKLNLNNPKRYKQFLIMSLIFTYRNTGQMLPKIP